MELEYQMDFLNKKSYANDFKYYDKTNKGRDREVQG